MTFILVENKGNMDKKAFLLLLGYIGYLFLGAAVFLHLEKSIQVRSDGLAVNAIIELSIIIHQLRRSENSALLFLISNPRKSSLYLPSIGHL